MKKSLLVRLAILLLTVSTLSGCIWWVGDDDEHHHHRDRGEYHEEHHDRGERR